MCHVGIFCLNFKINMNSPFFNCFQQNKQSNTGVHSSLNIYAHIVDTAHILKNNIPFVTNIRERPIIIAYQSTLANNPSLGYRTRSPIYETSSLFLRSSKRKMDWAYQGLLLNRQNVYGPTKNIRSIFDESHCVSHLTQQFSIDGASIEHSRVVEHYKPEIHFRFTKRPIFGIYAPDTRTKIPMYLRRVLYIGLSLLVLYTGLSFLLQFLLSRKRVTHVLPHEFPQHHPQEILDIMASCPGDYGYEVGNYFIVFNHHEWICNDGTRCLSMLNGFTTSNNNHYYYPTLQYYERVFIGEHFSVYKVGGSLFEHNLKAVYSNSLFKHPVTLFKALVDWWTLDETQFFHHEQHYHWLKRRVGHVVSFSICGTVAHHIDYDNNKITVVPLSVYSRIHNQARSCYGGSTLQQRVRAAVNTMITTSGIEIDRQITYALIDIYTKMNDSYNMYSTKPRIYNFIYDLPFHRNKLTKTYEYQRPCFRTDEYKPQKPYSAVNITSEHCLEKVQHWYSYGNPYAENNITYPKNCPCNGLRAIKNRSNCDLGYIDRQTMNVFYNYWTRNFSKLVDVTHYKSFDDHSWLNSLDAVKRALKAEGLTENQIIGIIDVHDTGVKAFIKMEPANFKISGLPVENQQIDPRVISGRYANYDSRAGARVKRVSKLFSSVWSYTANQQVEGQYKRTPGITYFSTGHNKISIGKWLKSVEDWNLYNTDYSRFDASTSVPLQMLEHDILYSLTNDPELILWLNSQLMTNGKMKWRDKSETITLSYAVQGTRKSGDQNTSIGNTIINVLVQLWALGVAHNKNPIDLINNNQVKFLVLGDDTVIATQFKINLVSYVTIIRNLGLTIDIAQKTKATVAFCSSYFIPALVNGEESYVLTQKPGRNLTRAYTSHIKYEEPGSWIKTNAYAFMNDYRHVPFMYSWHKSMHDKYSDCQAINITKLPDYNSEIHEMKHCPHNVTVQPSLRLQQWMEEVYGIKDYDFRLNDILGNPSESTRRVIQTDVYSPVVPHELDRQSLPKDFKIPSEPIKFSVPSNHLPTLQEYQTVTDNFIPYWQFRNPFMFEVDKNGKFKFIGPRPVNAVAGVSYNPPSNGPKPSPFYKDDYDVKGFRGATGIEKRNNLIFKEITKIIKRPRNQQVVPQPVPKPAVKPKPPIIQKQKSEAKYDADEKHEQQDNDIKEALVDVDAQFIKTFRDDVQKSFVNFNFSDPRILGHIQEAWKNRKLATQNNQLYCEPVSTPFGRAHFTDWNIQLAFSPFKNQIFHDLKIKRWGPPAPEPASLDAQMSVYINYLLNIADQDQYTHIKYVGINEDFFESHIRVYNDFVSKDAAHKRQALTCEKVDLSKLHLDLTQNLNTLVLVFDQYLDADLDLIYKNTAYYNHIVLCRLRVEGLAGSTVNCKWTSVKTGNGLTTTLVLPSGGFSVTNKPIQAPQVAVYTSALSTTVGVLGFKLPNLDDYEGYHFYCPDRPAILQANNTLQL